MRRIVLNGIGILVGIALAWGTTSQATAQWRATGTVKSGFRTVYDNPNAPASRPPLVGRTASSGPPARQSPTPAPAPRVASTRRTSHTEVDSTREMRLHALHDAGLSTEYEPTPAEELPSPDELFLDGDAGLYPDRFGSGPPPEYVPHGEYGTQGEYGPRGGYGPHGGYHPPVVDEYAPGGPDEWIDPPYEPHAACEACDGPRPDPGFCDGDCMKYGDCPGCEDYRHCGLFSDCGLLGRFGLLGFCTACEGHKWCPWQDLTFFTGAHGFKGPVDLGQSGNFGFHGGANWSGPLWHFIGLGWQVGGQAVSSNFSGSANAGMPGDSRNQYFITAGIYRRAWCRSHGWQWGVVADWLKDDYYQDITLSQVRAQLSHRSGCHEFGAWITSGTETEEIINVQGMMVQPRPVDIYALFFKRQTDTGAELGLFGGGTTAGDFIVGSDADIPISPWLAVRSNFTYMIPQSGGNTNGQMDEAWGINMYMVIYPGRTAKMSPFGRYRPMFNVADNSTFIVDR